MRPLSRRFYHRRTEDLARALLGKVIVCGDRAGQIVETEAYLGPEDLASHARFGPTDRARVMFGPAGVAYVYLIYGMYDMFNVVGHAGAEAGAVLVRAIAPVRGLGDDPAVGRGPGKLTRALGIRRADHDGVDLTAGGALFIAGGRRPGPIARGPRIGVDYAGAWSRAPLRFWIDGHPAVSRRR
ncbi:MAG: DNA-3-methyladenine glycosylase [Deltaproteobacteria bacterium]|nr:MAG: DNA-3-methyladenine glycosylase [Deltaproteobacteria bacterium]